jgi:hypothetical protein
MCGGVSGLPPNRLANINFLPPVCKTFAQKLQSVDGFTFFAEKSVDGPTFF